MCTFFFSPCVSAGFVRIAFGMAFFLLVVWLGFGVALGVIVGVAFFVGVRGFGGGGCCCGGWGFGLAAGGECESGEQCGGGVECQCVHGGFLSGSGFRR